MDTPLLVVLPVQSLLFRAIWGERQDAINQGYASSNHDIQVKNNNSSNKSNHSISISTSSSKQQQQQEEEEAEEEEE